MSWGPPAGSPFAGPGGASASSAAGLPFGGIPSELREKAERIMADEPVHPEPVITFSQQPDDVATFTLRRFLRPHRGSLAAATGLVVVETLALQAGPLLSQIGIDRGVLPRNGRVIALVALAYVAAVAVSMATGGLRIGYTGRLGERLTYELRVRVFSHLQRLSLDFYTGERSGRLMTRMTSDIDALTVLFQDGLVNLAVQGFTLAVVTVILFALNPTLALITLAVIVPALLGLTLWFRAASERGYNLVRDRIAEVLADLAENLAGARVISATNRRRHNVTHHANIVGSHRDANLVASRVGTIYSPATEGLGVIGQAVLLAVGGTMVLRGTLSVGELFAFLLYLATFFAPIQQLVQLYTTYQQGRAAVTKLAELLGTDPSVAEKPGAADLPPISGHVRLEGVTFGYGDGPDVLTAVDLDVRPGEVLAVVGPTGAGKSTIAKLVSRFYDPRAGRVLLDGHDVADVTLRSLRAQLGVVPQEAFLFAGTLGSNVAFARPGAAAAEIEAACRAVGLGPLLESLPAGLDTPVHERGVSLSAGERQLLALARAFFARPRVLVLDEATSNLDLQSEAAIEVALDAVLEGRTAIIIAHRLATAMRADRIAVVDEGRVVELGTHDELLGREGRYAAMYATWARHSGYKTDLVR